MKSDKKQKIILFLIGAFVASWLGVLAAPYTGGGLFVIVNGLGEALANPFKITWQENSVKAVLIALLTYCLVAGCIMTSDRNYRKREEYGSAKWGSASAVNRKCASRKLSENRILTNGVSIGSNSRKHGRNLNVMVCGGSGSGKTRYYCKPNILNAEDISIVALDPKGELLLDTGHYMEKTGHRVIVLDLLHMQKSHSYNPFEYLDDDNDVQKLVTNIYKNTTPKNSQTQDPFWDQAGQMLLKALIFYLKKEAPTYEQNFSTVLYLLRTAEIKEGDNSKSPLDRLFDRLAIRDPEHIALKYYKEYRSGSAKTLKSIQITLVSRLEKFNLDTLAAITKVDELDLERIGKEKTALYAIIPDNDTSFNFIVGMLYTQLFQKLYSLADSSPGKTLPVPVHFCMDEFANVALPDDFDQILSTMRSRGLSVSIILQNMAQIKALYKDQWEGITGNCDTYLYLGGNEFSTHEYVSKLLGKETVDLTTYGQSKGRNGSYSTNWQLTGRELLTPDEVRMLDNRYALLFIRGERPVMDLKYQLMKHPNIKYCTDGGAEPYIHGKDTVSSTSIKFEAPMDTMKKAGDAEKHNYIILMDTELNELISKKTEGKNPYRTRQIA